MVVSSLIVCTLSFVGRSYEYIDYVCRRHEKGNKQLKFPPHPDVLRPGIVGMRGSMVIRLRPRMTWAHPPNCFLCQLTAWSFTVMFVRWVAQYIYIDARNEDKLSPPHMFYQLCTAAVVEFSPSNAMFAGWHSQLTYRRKKDRKTQLSPPSLEYTKKLRNLITSTSSET